MVHSQDHSHTYHTNNVLIIRKMSTLSEFDICDEIPEKLREQIKFYHVMFNSSYQECVLFVTEDDLVYGLGYNGRGQLGSNHKSYVTEPEQVIELCGKGVKEFFVGFDFVLARTADHKLYSWGLNHHGQLGRGYLNPPGFASIPSEVKFLKNDHAKIVQVCCGYMSSMVILDNGLVYAWGKNTLCHTNLFGIMPIELPNGIHAKSVYCYSSPEDVSDDSCYFILASDGIIHTWIMNGLFEKDNTSSRKRMLNELKNYNIISVTSSKSKNFYFLSDNDDLFICGDICLNKSKLKNSSNTFLFIGKETFYFKFDGKFKNLTKLSDPSIERDDIVVMCSKGFVYELDGITIRKTNYKSIEEYSVHNVGITYRTLETKLRERKISCNHILGRGSFGQVFAAEYQDEKFAVKKMLMSGMYKGMQDKNCELEIIKNLNCENIVQYHEHWTTIEHGIEFLYIQMEYCDQTLKSLIDAKSTCDINLIMDYVICCEILHQFLEGVNYLHTRNPKIIYRDLKPTNVLVKYQNDGDAKLKLCDFGLSKNIEENNSSLVGTSRYAAPELSSNDYNEKVDVFSLGMCIRELFASILKHDIETTAINGYKSLFVKKFTVIKDQIYLMIHGDPKKRPSCSQILNLIDLWSFKSDEINQEFILSCIKNDDEYNLLKFFKIRSLYF